MVKKFVGWIDERELKKVKKSKTSSGYIFPARSLTIYDKHWYDGRCIKVEVKVTKIKK